MLRASVRHFDRYLIEQGVPTTLAAIRREHVEAFIESLLSRFHASTAANRYAGLQAFFAWHSGRRRHPEDGESLRRWPLPAIRWPICHREPTRPWHEPRHHRRPTTVEVESMHRAERPHQLAHLRKRDPGAPGATAIDGDHQHTAIGGDTQT